MPPVLGFAFKPSARNFTVPALSVSYTLPPHRRVRDFHPLEKSAAKRTKDPLAISKRIFLYASDLFKLQSTEK